MAKYILHFLVFLFISNISTSQVNYIHYTPADGLAQTQVMCLLQDSKGYIWVGTKAGISRFDGISFKNFTTNDGIKGSEIYQIYETEKGEIWILTKYGLHKKNGDKFIFYDPKPYAETFAMCVYDSGKFYLTKYEYHKPLTYAIFYIFENGKYKLYDDKHKNLRFCSYRYKLLFSNEGSESKGLNEYKFYDKNFRLLYKQNLLPEIPNVIVGNVYLNNIFSFEKGKFELTGKINYDKKKMDNFVYSNSLIIDDKSKTLFFTIVNGPVKIYRPINPNADFLEYNEVDIMDFNINNANCIMQDSEKNIWIGGENGLYRIVPFMNYGKESNMPDYVWSIAEDNYKKIWFAPFQDSYKNFSSFDYQSGKIVKADTAIFSNIDFKDSNKNNLQFYMGAKAISNGKIFFTTNIITGFLFNGKKIQTINYKDNFIGLMVYEDSVNVIISNNGGLFYLKGKELIKIDGYKVSDYGNALDITRGKDNKIYIASSRGIVLFDDLKNKFSFMPNDSIPLKGTYSVIKDYKGNLWFASSNGLFFYDYINFKKIHNPELEYNISSLHIYKDITLFIGGLRGIGLINLKRFYEKNDTTVRFYDKSSGFLGNEVAQNCIFEDSRHNIWVATNSNVVRFNPEELTQSKYFPLLYIENIIGFDKNFNYRAIDSTHRLSHEYINITINFTGIYHKAPQQVFYKWELQGFDKSVSPMTKNRSVTYTNLKPGKYTFKLWACNESDIWTKDPFVYEFEIIPAFWQRLWFKIISSFLLLIFVFLLTYFITKRIQKSKLILKEKEIEIITSKLKGQEQEKQRIARELHDGIGGGLAALKMRSHTMLSEPNKLEIQKLIDEIYGEVRQISHDLSMPFSANLNESIKNYMKRTLSDSKIHYSYTCVPETDWKNVNKSTQNQLYRIIQEGITNAIKHSEATEIELQIVFRGKIINLSIEDNGKGFDTKNATPESGIGLSNMFARTTALNGKINIDSSPGSGTIINVEIPF
jgi:signal transduction histidine kinase